MTDIVNCDEIYGLYLIDPCCNLDQYICAVSFDKEILNNILDKYVENDKKKYYIIKKVKYCSVNLINNKIIIREKKSISKNIFDKSLYAFNKIIVKDNNEICEQVLLNINEVLNINEKLNINQELNINVLSFFLSLENNNSISDSEIKFDKYYHESIMNA